MVQRLWLKTASYFLRKSVFWFYMFLSTFSKINIAARRSLWVTKLLTFYVWPDILFYHSCKYFMPQTMIECCCIACSTCERFVHKTVDWRWLVVFTMRLVVLLRKQCLMFIPSLILLIVIINNNNSKNGEAVVFLFFSVQSDRLTKTQILPLLLEYWATRFSTDSDQRPLCEHHSSENKNENDSFSFYKN